jgi:hypothetical protein
MHGWVRYRRGRAQYTGGITRAPLAAWLATPAARATLEGAASHVRFPFLVKQRAARRVWRQLAAIASDGEVVQAIQNEIEAYLGRLQHFAYAEGLPCVGVDLHRLVIVPRVLINAAAHAAIAARLRSQRAFITLGVGDALRQFFVDTLIHDLEHAIARSKPSPAHPLTLGKEWISVGLNGAFAWRVPLQNEPPWDGHHYVLELTREPITRSVRRAVDAAMQRMEGALPSLSRTERNEILRRALRGA